MDECTDAMTRPACLLKIREGPPTICTHERITSSYTRYVVVKRGYRGPAYMRTLRVASNRLPLAADRTLQNYCPYPTFTFSRVASQESGNLSVLRVDPTPRVRQ